MSAFTLDDLKGNILENAWKSWWELIKSIHIGKDLPSEIEMKHTFIDPSGEWFLLDGRFADEREVRWDICDRFQTDRSESNWDAGLPFDIVIEYDSDDRWDLDSE
jgi:hypothetical protein